MALGRVLTGMRSRAPSASGACHRRSYSGPPARLAPLWEDLAAQALDFFSMGIDQRRPRHASEPPPPSPTGLPCVLGAGEWVSKVRGLSAFLSATPFCHCNTCISQWCASPCPEASALARDLTAVASSSGG